MKNLVIGVLLYSLLPAQVNAELGLVIEGDPIVAFNTANEAAKNGDIEAQYRLGRMYSQGLIVQKNSKKSFYWIEKAALSDHQEALYFLGLIYLSGTKPAQKDHEKGVMYLTRSAELGLLQAKKKLAFVYLYPGQQKHKNISEGMKWLIDAAESGDSATQMMLGAMYVNGINAEKDQEKGLHWIMNAAEQGNEDALFELGKIYYTGKYLPRDLVKSRCMLGLSILHGARTLKTAKDREKAKNKRQLLDSLTAQMTDSQKEESRKMAIDWMNTHKVDGVDASRIVNIL